MNSSLTALILVVFTVAIALSAFSVYSYFFSSVSASAAGQEFLIAMSKSFQVYVSAPTYVGLSPNYTYFNVSYMVSFHLPAGEVVVIPFVGGPQPNPSLYLPTLPQNSTFFLSTDNGYAPLKAFPFSANVYLPQEGKLIGYVSNVYAYELTANQTYVLSSIVKVGQVVYLWVLYNYQGKWYRVGFTYFNPFNQGVGVYALTSSGKYNQENQNGVHQPLEVSSNKGLEMGLWFDPLNFVPVNSTIVNMTLVTVSNNKNTFISIVLSQYQNSLMVTVYENGNCYSSTQVYNNLQEGQPYYVNITLGSQLSPLVSLYLPGGTLLGSVQYNLPPGSTNGYLSYVQFGNKEFTTDVISQAFFATLQSNQGTTVLAQASDEVLFNGFLYNNTKVLYNIIYGNSNIIYAIAYWTFSYAYYPPPSQTYGIMWYYTTYKVLETAYLPEVGINTYQIV